MLRARLALCHSDPARLVVGVLVVVGGRELNFGVRDQQVGDNPVPPDRGTFARFAFGMSVNGRSSVEQRQDEQNTAIGGLDSAVASRWLSFSQAST